MKRKSLIVLAVVVVAAIGIFSWFKGSYNAMVQRSETVQAQLGNVENQYQRRADLIPNLVNTVKGYASHEQNTLTEVVNARAKATQVHIDIDDAEAMARFNQAQGELSSALSRLMAISESYPDLKANQNFRDLQTQLEGTENRIAVERRKFNEEARAFNTYIKMFPRNLLAGMFGFQPMAYFEAQEGARTAPEVQF
ncbi:LemA family protein [uncultured Alistipes sp.]|uniref:LemA family protein n=1 Tax=uncultured Alistipes sp. TaxID=538949 RepID=UPI002606165F|nr:LemA family protein [uncultured Alistipes sp.]